MVLGVLGGERPEEVRLGPDSAEANKMRDRVEMTVI